jgi:HSP20 family molecular chaperone IbpA
MSTEMNSSNASNNKQNAEMGKAAISPPVDVYENQDEFMLLMDLPGVGKDNLHIHLEKGQLVLEAERVSPQPSRVLASEFRGLRFRRAFSVPQDIDAEKVRAELADGVLRVSLPKSAALKPRRIQVQAG